MNLNKVDNDKFSKEILKEYVKYANSKINYGVIEKIERRIRPLYKILIEETPTYKDIVSGYGLRTAIGFPIGEEKTRIDEVIDTFSHEMKIDFRRFIKDGNDYSCQFDFFVYDDSSTAFSLQEAVIITDKGVELPWLDWLCNQGNRIIIDTHRVVFGDFSSPDFRSRSQGALMFKHGNFKIPSEYASNGPLNFITRAFSDLTGKEFNNTARPLISKVIEEEIEKALN